MTLTLLCVPEGKDYLKLLVALIKKSKSRVCYVTLNKSCRSLLETFKKEGINGNKVFFIDGISARLEEPLPVKNCNFVSAPYDLSAMSGLIVRAVHAKYTFLIFDSLSNLLVYGPAIPAGVDILVKFIGRFFPDLKKQHGRAVFVCKSKDKTNLLIQETLSAFDRVKEVK